MRDSCVRFGVVGVRGFSEKHLEWLGQAAAAGGPVRLAAVATIEDGCEALCEKLADDGVAVVRDYADLLALRREIDIITLPVGIHLHVPLAEQALAAGYSVYLEKPVAGTCAEAGKLLAAERRAKGRVLAGFQTMYHPSTWELKRRLVGGIIGDIQKIIVTVQWSRHLSYYRRNSWAGKIAFGGGNIYDSPMQNAAGHFLNTALFLAGSTERRWADPVGVEAELYRANPIESADSTFARFTTGEGVLILFNATHCVEETLPGSIDVIGSAGRVLITDRAERRLAPWTEVNAQGVQREVGAEIDEAHVFSRIAEAHLNPDLHEICTLESATHHTLANEMAFQSTEIHNFPVEEVDCIECADGDSLMVVKGMQSALASMRESSLLPNELGKTWGPPAPKLDPTATQLKPYPTFP